MLNRVWTFTLLVHLIVFAAMGNASASELDAASWIEKMRRAGAKESYRGTFMFSRGDMSSSMRVVHRYHNDQEQERLTQLDGEMGEILRRGNEVMCLVNGQKLVQLDKQQLTNPVSTGFKDFMPGNKHYTVHKRGQERVVDRSSVRLEIKASDALRYSYALWVDQSTGLLLKSQVLGLEGRVLELFQFTELELPTKTLDEEFEFALDSKAISHQTIPMSKTDERWPEQLIWEADYLPEGFMRIEASGSNRNVMLYSDGLANYTVFVELKSRDTLPVGASIVGATVIYLSPLEFNKKEYTVTVIGEIPPMTAMKVAKGVRPVMD